LEHAELTEVILGAAFEVHSKLGPGMLESAYEACLAYELSKAGAFIERQKAVPLVYKEILLDVGYRIDLLVERTVVVELKAVERLERVHEAQLISYLRLAKCPVGLLINFNTPSLRSGIRRFANTQPPKSSAPSAHSAVDLKPLATRR
jgi:GxxExxY protein